MSKRKRTRQKRQEDLEDLQEMVQPAAEADESEAWNTPEFRNKVLIDLAFVAAPAIIMLLLGERIWAAGWFGVGVLVVIWQFWGQIRAFARALRSGGRAEEEERP